MLSELESNIVAVERVKEYSRTETEVGTGMRLGWGDLEWLGKGARWPAIPIPHSQLLRWPFIYSFIPSAFIEYQLEFYARRYRGFPIEQDKGLPLSRF